MQSGRCILGRQPPLSPERTEALYLLRWTHEAQAQLAHKLCDDSLMTAEAAYLLLTELLAQLMAISEDVFETVKREFMAHDNPLLELEPRLATVQQRRAASDWLLSELERTNADIVFDRAPLLREALDRTTTRFVAVTDELLERFIHDRDEICRMLYGGADCGAITQICFAGADPHFHGRRTSIVKTQRGAFVYRPRDCRIDERLCDMVQRGFADYLKIPRCIVRNGYGYCEFMRMTDVASPGDVAMYFKRLGGACALLHALGSTDLHSENWICCDGYPALVDLETILTPLPRAFGDRHIWPEADLRDDFRRDISRSLIFSGILPARRGNRQISVLLDDSDTAHGLPVLNGVKRTVIGFEDSFLDGFAEGYERCMGLRRELNAALECFRMLPVRALIRNSDGYSKLLSQLHSLPALQSRQGRSRLLSRLDGFFREHGAEQLLPIANWEAQCLLDGDIPYFSSSGGGRALMGYGDVINENFFQMSAMENARQRIATLCHADMRFELNILSQSLDRAVMPVAASPVLPAAGPTEAIAARAALAEAEAIFGQIERLLITAPSGKSAWLVLSERSMRLTPAKPTLSNGTAGIGVFCAALAASSDDPEIRRRASTLTRMCLDQLAHYITRLEQARCLPERLLPLGISDGIAGVLRALALIERYSQHEWPRLLTQKVIRLLDNLEIDSAQHMDVYMGTAGLLLALCHCQPQFDSADIPKHIRRTAKRLLAQRQLETRDGLLLWDTLGKARPISGAGHGMAGIAAALMSAARVLGDSGCADAASAALAFEHRIYSDKLKTWPDLRSSSVISSAMHGICSGAPGIGLALLWCRTHQYALTAQLRQTLEHDIARAAHTCLQHEPLYRDHVCCGNCAAVEFLLAWPGGYDAAGRLLTYVVSRKRQSGSYNYFPDGFRQVPSPELFHGASGIGYELLRYAKPDTIVPLIF